MPRHTRSGRVYDEDAVSDLPFDPNRCSKIYTGDPTSYGRPRIAWDYFTNLVSRWPSVAWTSFLFSDPFYERPGDDWIPQYPLGQGGYGKVAKWAKLDAIGNVLDELAIKEAKASPSSLYAPDLTREAVIHGHLTAMKASKDTISQLRGYKMFTQQTNTEADKVRLYLRYEPLEDLGKLDDRYMAFDQFLPELFLWSMLRDFAEANTLLKRCPSTWNPVTVPPFSPNIPPDFARDTDKFLLHLDVKPGNFLIGPRPAEKPRCYYPPRYPRIRMADFGFTTPKSAQSQRRRSFDCGTTNYINPEQLGYSKFWPRHEGHDLYRTQENQFQLSETTDSFSIGKVLYVLMTLQYQGDQLPGIHHAPTNRARVVRQEIHDFNDVSVSTNLYHHTGCTRVKSSDRLVSDGPQSCCFLSIRLCPALVPADNPFH